MTRRVDRLCVASSPQDETADHVQSFVCKPLCNEMRRVKRLMFEEFSHLRLCGFVKAKSTSMVVHLRRDQLVIVSGLFGEFCVVNL